ncbi:MAG: hypothetical protein IJF78_01585 [Clostridia bacterium]|nr:hypothetical protein [Clostridia bacterium]
MLENANMKQDTGNNPLKIGILGGDQRQLVMIHGLSQDYECAVWGFDGVYGTPDEKYLADAVRCADWKSAVKGSAAVILPLPCTRDGALLNTPLTKSGDAVSLTDIADRMSPGALLTGGMMPPVFRRYAGERGIFTADYYDSEELQIRNAVPTAEGAIAACIAELPVTIAGMKAAVFGYGRVGRTLAQRLLSLGAEVYAVARSPRDRAWAECDGCIPVVLDEYRKHPVPADALFNTVPHCVLDEDVLSGISRESVIFELASGGTDVEAAKELGIRVVPLPSLPGKTSPVTAGGIILSAVKEIMKNGLRKE